MSRTSNNPEPASVFDEAVSVSGLAAQGLGILQEANRQWFMPRGMCLTTSPNGFSIYRFPTLSGGLTYEDCSSLRNNPEKSVEKAALAGKNADRLRMERIRQYGFVIEPVPGQPEPTLPAVLSVDDWTMEVVISLVTRVADLLSECFTGTAVAQTLLSDLIGPLFSKLELVEGGLLRARHPLQDLTQDEASLTPYEVARARFLAREMPFLCREHESKIPDVNGVVQEVTQRCELLEAEVEEAMALSAEVLVWDYDVLPENVKKVFGRLESLYELAQPGMGFWRGEPKARERWDEVKVQVQARLEEYVSSRDEVSAVLAGDVPMNSIRDPEAVRAAIEVRLAPLQAALDEADKERNRLALEMGPMVLALARLKAA